MRQTATTLKFKFICKRAEFDGFVGEHLWVEPKCPEM